MEYIVGFDPDAGDQPCFFDPRERTPVHDDGLRDRLAD